MSRFFANGSDSESESSEEEVQAPAFNKATNFVSNNTIDNIMQFNKAILF